MKLDFIIIGGQKCGSTYLHHVINEHPEIEMVPGESPQFESPDYENEGLQDLKIRLAALNQDMVLGIKRPNYLSIEDVPERIKKVNDKVKLIVIIRNPIERFKSSYFHQMNNGFCPIMPLNEGADKIIDGSLFKNYPRTVNILKYGMYSHYLKQYLNLFQRNLLILTYDELTENKMGVIKKCYSFLGVKNTFIPHKALNSQPQKVNYSLSRARLITKMNKHRYSYNENGTRLFLKEQSKWDKFYCSSIYLFDNLMFKNLVKNEKPEFSDKVRNKLYEKYKPDIENLEELLNIDLSKWKNLI